MQPPHFLNRCVLFSWRRNGSCVLRSCYNSVITGFCFLWLNLTKSDADVFHADAHICLGCLLHFGAQSICHPPPSCDQNNCLTLFLKRKQNYKTFLSHTEGTAARSIMKGVCNLLWINTTKFIADMTLRFLFVVKASSETWAHTCRCKSMARILF